MKLLYYIFTAILAIILLQGCKPSVSLFATDPDYKGKYILYNQTSKGLRDVNNSDIEALYKQKAQYKLFGITPYLTIHYIGKSFYDTTYIKQEIKATKVRFDKKITKKQHTEKRYLAIVAKRKRKIAKLQDKLINGNWMMGSFGEYPSILDTSIIRYTRDQISKYLFSKGYFNNDVNYKIDTLGRKTFVKYVIKEGDQYTYGRITAEIEDTAILKIVRDTKGSKLEKNDPYDQTKIDTERDRIFKLLKNNGYYEFSKEYIGIIIDSSKLGNHKIKLTVEILNPEVSMHQRFKINDVI